MLKCLCCRGSNGGRHKGGGGGGGDGGGSKFSLESDPEKAGGDSSGRYRRKKLDDDPDRVDAGAYPPPPVGATQQLRQPALVRPPQPTTQRAVVAPTVARQPELATTGISHHNREPDPQPVPASPQRSHGSPPDLAEAAVEVPRRVEVQHVQFRQSRPEQQEPPVQHQQQSHNDEIEVHEVEIVDSDFEAEEEEQVAELKQPVKPVGTGNRGGSFSGRSTATLSVVMPRQRLRTAAAAHATGSEEEEKVAAERLSTFLLAAEDEDPDAPGSVWQTLPSGLKPSATAAGRHHLDALIEEEPIVSQPLPDSKPQSQQDGFDNAAFSGASGELSPGFASVDDPTARASLLALDRALAVFELAEVDDDVLGMTMAGGQEDEATAGFVDDEELILPLSSGRD